MSKRSISEISEISGVSTETTLHADKIKAFESEKNELAHHPIIKPIYKMAGTLIDTPRSVCDFHDTLEKLLFLIRNAFHGMGDMILFLVENAYHRHLMAMEDMIDLGTFEGFDWVYKQFITKSLFYRHHEKRIFFKEVLEKNLTDLDTMISMIAINWEAVDYRKCPSFFWILKKNLDKLECWNLLSLNPNALHLLERNQGKIKWDYLSENPSFLACISN